MSALARSTILAAIAALLIPAVSPVPANAQQARCADRARVLDMLQTRFGETRRGMGIAAERAVMELFASAETGSWTITVTFAGGTTCLLASGHGFEAVDEMPLPAGEFPA